MTKTRSWVRGGSIGALVAVPALAVAVLGNNMLAGANVPSLRIAETRDFTVSGENLATPAKVNVEDSNEVFLGTWQNTLLDLPTKRA